MSVKVWCACDGVFSIAYTSEKTVSVKMFCACNVVFSNMCVHVRGFKFHCPGFT